MKIIDVHLAPQERVEFSCGSSAACRISGSSLEEGVAELSGLFTCIVTSGSNKSLR